MKRIIFIISLLVTLTGFSQVTPNYPQKPATPTAFRHLMADSVLWLPYGGTPRLREPAATTRPGALFVVVTTTDTTLMLWTGERWVNIAGTTQASALQNELIFGGTVTPLGGSDFFVQEAIYRIDNVIFQTPDDTVTISASDPTLNRLDRIYLSEDQSGAHVLEGVPAASALEPQVDGDQIGLAFISIPAGSVSPTLVTQVVYNDNAGESTVTNTGTTTDPDNTTNVFLGTKSLNVTNINDPSNTIGDLVLLTRPTGSWSALGFDGFSLFIKLKAVMAGAANLRIQFIASGVAVSTEVIIPINKSNITTFQGITISAAAFGNITNTSITAVRIRYTRPGNTANYTGFYLDNMFFVDGVAQQPTGNVSITLIPPVGFLNSPSNTITNTGTITTTPNGSGFDYYSPSGWADFPTFVTSIGDFDARAHNADGATIDGTEIFFHPVDATFPGMMTSAMFNKLDSNYWIANVGNLDSLATPDPVFPNITLIKTIGCIGCTVITTDTTVIFDMTGVGGGSSLFPVTGTGTATGDVTGAVGTNNLAITVEENGSFGVHNDGGGGDWSGEINVENNVVELLTTSLLGDANIILGTSVINFNSGTGNYQFEDLADDLTATKVVVYNTTSDQIGTVDLAGLGGGGITQEQSEDFTGAMFATDNGDIDFTYNDGTPDIGAQIKAGAIVNADITDVAVGKITGFGTNVGTWLATPSSANLLAAITDETGTGVAVFGTTPTITTPVFSGAISTTAAVQFGTNASGTGYIPFVQSIIVRSDETLSNSSADQNLFTNTAHDVITVQANTTYQFFITGDLTHGAVSHSIALGFTPTTATVTSIEYNAYAWVTAVGTATASQVSARIKATATSVINLAGANATETFEAHGTITIGTGGTITPQIKFSADPTGTILLKAGARMHIWPIGNDTFTEQGNIN